MAPLTVEQARIVLKEAYGIGDEQPLLRCRINYFEAAYIALPPSGLAVVRQDMLGRQTHIWIPLDQISEPEKGKTRNGKPSLKFEVEGVVWQIDRVLKDRWPEVFEHVLAKPAPSAPTLDAEAEAVQPAAVEPPSGSTADPATEPAEVVRPPTATPAPVSLPASAERLASPIDDLLDQLEREEEDQAPILRRLFHQCQAQQQGDQALIAAQCLVVLDQAGPLERQHVDRYKSPRLLAPTHFFTPEVWADLLPLAEPDRALTRVANALTPALIRMTARPHKAYGLGPRGKEADHLVFGRIFEVIKNALVLPELSYHPLLEQDKTGLLFANLAEGVRWAPTLVVGTDLLAGHSEAELAFLIARELTYLTKDHLLRVLAPNLAQQAVLVLTAVAMAEPNQPIAGDQEEAIKAQLKHLSAHMELDDFEHVGNAVRSLLSQAEPFDLGRWNHSVDRAALRAGLVLCGDVEIAAQSLPRLLSEDDVARTRAALIRFAVSRAHQRIRRTLGLAIQD